MKKYGLVLVASLFAASAFAQNTTTPSDAVGVHPENSTADASTLKDVHAKKKKHHKKYEQMKKKEDALIKEKKEAAWQEKKKDELKKDELKTDSSVHNDSTKPM